MYSSTSANILAQSKGIQQRFFTEPLLVSPELWKQKRLLSSAGWMTRVVPVKRKKGECQVYIRSGWDWQLPDTTQWGSNFGTVSRMFTTRDSEKLSERVVISRSDTFYSPWGPSPNLPCDLSTCYCPLVLSTCWWHWPWKAHGLICKWYYCVWKNNSILGRRLEVDVNVETEQVGDYFQAPVCAGRGLRRVHTKQYASWHCCHCEIRQVTDLSPLLSHAHLSCWGIPQHKARPI